MSQASITPQALADWCDTYLQANAYQDYCPNGLQVDADKPIKKLITGVTASQNLIDSAVAMQADAILVHHGYFWRGEAAALVGMKGNRIRSLLQNNVSLLAYHLPLDGHPEVGNNAVLAKQLGLEISGALFAEESHPVGNIARCDAQPMSTLINKVSHALGRVPLHIAANRPDEGLIETVGLCSGGAQNFIEQAAMRGCDVYLSGEISEKTTHAARELGIDYLACGHHATEKGGVQSLGKLIQQTHGIEVIFVDDPNPA